MTIDWRLVRRAMLTPSNLFPENPNANCMSTTIRPDQMAVVRRCINAFYQGLQWADQFGIRGGYVGNRSFRRSFIINDDYILGVFDNRSQYPKSPYTYPQSTLELVQTYEKGRSNIKTLIVLEKEHYRLANSDSVGNQSKFLIDVVYPAIEGIRAKFSGDITGQHWKTRCLKAQQTPSQLERSHPQSSSELLPTSLLSDIYHSPQTADRHLAKQSPLQLFYQLDSPLNIDFNTEDDTKHPYIPWIAALPSDTSSPAPHADNCNLLLN